MKYTITALLLLVCAATHAQSKKDIDAIDNKCQKCLDEGMNMMGCELTHYTETDSLLNTAYNRLRRQLSPAAFEELKKEQKEWLKKRDAYFKKLKAEAGDDARETELLPVYLDEVNYVKERLEVLISKLK